MDVVFIIGVSLVEFFLCIIFLLVVSIFNNIFKFFFLLFKDNLNWEDKSNIRSVFLFWFNFVNDFLLFLYVMI